MAEESGQAPKLGKQSPPVATFLPTLVGEDDGIYRIRARGLLLSFILHVLSVALLLGSTSFVLSRRAQIQRQVISLVADVSPYILPPAPKRSGGGGGGGDRDKVPASKGALPKLSRDQFAPPAAVIRNSNPKLAMEPTIVVPPEIQLPQNGMMGDPMSNILGPLSNGTGSGGGIGSGSGGGVGSGRGPGVGPGYGGGIGGGIYRVGGGISAPRVVYAPDPGYSEEARKSKYQGTVVLWVVVGPDGRTREIRVLRSLGMGLDENAVEAVRRWRFEPARRDGLAVAVQVNIEVNFRLY